MPVNHVQTSSVMMLERTRIATFLSNRKRQLRPMQRQTLRPIHSPPTVVFKYSYRLPAISFQGSNQEEQTYS